MAKVIVSETPKPKKHERKDFAFGISLTEFVISVVVGIGSGLATAAKTANDLFTDDAKNASTFKQHFEDRSKRLDAIDLQDMLVEGKSKLDYHKAIHREKKLLREEFNEIAFYRRGISKNPILASIDRFKILGQNSKRDLYFTATVGAVIGAAVTLGFFNGVATRDKIDKIADAVNADKER